jgi:hypothetical protein
MQYSKGPYFPALGDFDTAGAVQIYYVNTLPHDLALATAGMFGYYRGLGAMSRAAGAGNLLAAAEYVHANGPWTFPDNYNKGNLVLNYSQGNPENGFSFTGMYMNDAFHATNQIPQRAVREGLICLYCPLDPTDGGSSERYSFSTRYAATTAAGLLDANAYLIGYQLQLFNNFDGFVTFPPPIGYQFVQQDRRKIYGAMSAMRSPETSSASTRETRSVSRPAPTTFTSSWRKPRAAPCSLRCATITSSSRAPASLSKIESNGRTSSAL